MADQERETGIDRAARGIRGRVEIDFDRCGVDGACTEACPTPALELVRHDGAGGTGRRATLTLDLGQCIFCGLCEEACPSGAITLSAEIELATRRRDDLVTTALFGDRRPRQDEDAGAGDRADDGARRARGRVHALFGGALKTFHVDAGSCNGCELELIQATGPDHDLSRFGLEFSLTPETADLLLITGPITAALEPAVRSAYDAMRDGRRVLAVGACAIGGGIYRAAPGEPSGVEGWLDADVYVPGCPPSPQAILHGLGLLLDRAEQKVRARHWYGRHPD